MGQMGNRSAFPVH